jgi:mono/diheme cytochrome c family protein
MLAAIGFLSIGEDVMSRRGATITLLIVTVLVLGLNRTNAAESWYTSDQAAAGHQLYNNFCAECHRPDLSGAMGPALLGSTFKERWGGKTVEELYKFEHLSMPPLSPGSLTANELFPITAYILKKNGLAAGNTALSEETAARLTLPK